jgi:hypothetical protein
VKVRIVRGLEGLCDATHFVTYRRPWLWFFPYCPLARLSYSLDERWGTRQWVSADDDLNGIRADAERLTGQGK